MTRAGHTVHVRLAGATDVGLVREHNEDSFLVVDLDRGTTDLTELREYDLGESGTLLLVCDGMGGAAAGEVASAMAVSGMRRLLLSSLGPRTEAGPLSVPRESAGEAKAAEEAGPEEARPPGPGEAEGQEEKAAKAAGAPEAGPSQKETAPDEVLALARQMRDAAYAVNLEIFEAACADMAKAGMGTTLTALVLRRERVIVAQVGDSRAYLWRQGKLTQITHDQSLVNQLLDSGQITPEQAKLFEHSNVILQALGVQEDVEVLVSTEELVQGDRVLLCSDGLVGVVSDEEIEEVLGLSDNLGDTVQTLIDMARAAGGPDNITVIVAQVQGEGLPPATQESEVQYRPILLDPPERRYRLEDQYGDEGQDPPGTPASLGSPPLSMAAVLSMAWVIGLLVAGAVVGVLLYPRTPPSHIVPRGSLCYFIADIPGLDVLIDGQRVARTGRPGTEVPIAPGHYRVNLREVSQGGVVLGKEQDLYVVPGQRCALKLGPLPPAPPLPAGSLAPPDPAAVVPAVEPAGTAPATDTTSVQGTSESGETADEVSPPEQPETAAAPPGPATKPPPGRANQVPGDKGQNKGLPGTAPATASGPPRARPPRRPPAPAPLLGTAAGAEDAPPRPGPGDDKKEEGKAPDTEDKPPPAKAGASDGDPGKGAPGKRAPGKGEPAEPAQDKESPPAKGEQQP